MGLVEDHLNDVRGQIAADDNVLSEARDRRNLVASIASEVDGYLRRFNSGSVAHGTVNHPVTDADGGIVIDRRKRSELGPDGEGPAGIVDEVCKLAGPKLRETYPDAQVNKSKRGLKVLFKEPMVGDGHRDEEQDPTVDLIVTLTRDQGGLWIPNLDRDEWEPSDPETHTNLFTGGTRDLKALRARIIRLGKAWNKQWSEGNRIISSFNVTALGWEHVTDPSVGLDEAMTSWFEYAADELGKANTEDPAEVSDPIKLLQPRDKVVERLRKAADLMREAMDNEDDAHLVQTNMSKVFRDYIDPPADSAASTAAAFRDGAVGASKVGLVVGSGTEMKSTRSYGHHDG